MPVHTKYIKHFFFFSDCLVPVSSHTNSFYFLTLIENAFCGTKSHYGGVRIIRDTASKRMLLIFAWVQVLNALSTTNEFPFTSFVSRWQQGTSSKSICMVHSRYARKYIYVKHHINHFTDYFLISRPRSSSHYSPASELSLTSGRVQVRLPTSATLF